MFKSQKYENECYFTLFDIYKMLENKVLIVNDLPFTIKTQENTINHMQRQYILFVNIHHKQIIIDTHTIFNNCTRYWNYDDSKEMAENLIFIAKSRIKTYIENEDNIEYVNILQQAQNLSQHIDASLK